MIIQTISSLLLLALYVIPGLDHRFHWSTVSTPVVLLADLLVVLGFLIIFLVCRENSYTSGVVKVEIGQQVICDRGLPVVRHPMYSGSSLLFLATPFALGSPSGRLVAAVSLCGVMVVRLLDEDAVLSAELPGYDDYRPKGAVPADPHGLVRSMDPSP